MLFLIPENFFQKCILFFASVFFYLSLCFLDKLCDNASSGRPPQSQPPKPLMAIRLSSGFSHLQPGVFHISLQTHKTQHTYSRGWKKRRTNNHGLGLTPSPRRESFLPLLCSFLCICELSRACIRAKCPQHHRERWLILSGWPTRPLGLHVLAVAFLWPSAHPDFCRLLTALFCFLPRDLAFPRLLPVSLEISRASPLCGLRAKTDKGIFWLALTHTHTHRNECPTLCHNWLYFLSMFLGCFVLLWFCSFESHFFHQYHNFLITLRYFFHLVLPLVLWRQDPWCFDFLCFSLFRGLYLNIFFWT